MRDYIAFISYRHIRADEQVASRLHRRIEHYRVPKDIKSEREDRRLGYVFRDKDELPASSNLTKDIYEALDHSRFLIVVCSPRTKESMWVRREVEYFLKHHDRNHVLAVLLGDPRDSFLDLLTEERDEDGRLIDYVEPLAANLVCKNWRERPTIFWKESLRLLAGILGCSFDSLYQRERHERTLRRLMVGGLAVLILALFIGMSVRNDLTLRQKNDEVLLQMANTAEKTLQAGDMPLAVDIAAGVLSKCGEGPDKSRALAEQVLNDAMTPYSIYTPHVAAVITQSEDIEAFRLSRDEKTLLTIDDCGRVRAYDIESARLLWQNTDDEKTDVPPKSGAGLFVTGSAAIVKNADAICAYDVADGAPLWQIPIRVNGNYDYAVLSHKGDVLAFSALGEQGGHVVRFLSTRDGAIIKEIAFPRGDKFINSGLANNLPKGWCTLGAFDGEDRYFYGYWFSGAEIRYYRTDLSDGSEECFFAEPMHSDRIGRQDRLLYMGCLDSEGRLMVIRQPREKQDALLAEIIDAGSKPAAVQRTQLHIDTGWQQNPGAYQSLFGMGDNYVYGIVDRYMFVVNRDSLAWDTHVFDSEIVALRLYPDHSDFFNIITGEGDYRVCWVKDGLIGNTYGDKLDALALGPTDQCAVIGDGMIALPRANLEGNLDIKSDICDGRVLCVPKACRNSLRVYALEKPRDSRLTWSPQSTVSADRDWSEVEGEAHEASFEGRTLTMKRKDSSAPLWTRSVPFWSDRLRQASFLDADRWFAAVTLDNRALIYDVATGDELFFGVFPFVRDSKAGVKAAKVSAEIAMKLNREENRLYIYAAHDFGDGICIDTKSWTRAATIPDMFDYAPETGVISVTDTNYTVYDFAELDAAALLERAGAIRRSQDAQESISEIGD